MTATIASCPWPSPAVARIGLAWRFAREQASPPRWRFDLRRNVALRPAQLLLAYALVCALSSTVAAGFWWQGVRVVGVFTGIELIAVGVAMWLVARHAGDRETIVLDTRELAVERRVGADVEHVSFRPEWVRVEPASAVGSLVELSGRGRSVRVGRHVRPELRAELADELRRALRLSRSVRERSRDHGFSSTP